MYLCMGARGATTVRRGVQHANVQGTRRGDPISGLQARPKQRQQAKAKQQPKAARAQVGEGNQADLLGKSLELREGKGMMVYHGRSPTFNP